jgi:hypothetical protein
MPLSASQMEGLSDANECLADGGLIRSLVSRRLVDDADLLCQ